MLGLPAFVTGSFMRYRKNNASERFVNTAHLPTPMHIVCQPVLIFAFAFRESAWRWSAYPSQPNGCRQQSRLRLRSPVQDSGQIDMHADGPASEHFIQFKPIQIRCANPARFQRFCVAGISGRYPYVDRSRPVTTTLPAALNYVYSLLLHTTIGQAVIIVDTGWVTRCYCSVRPEAGFNRWLFIVMFRDAIAINQ